MKSLLLPSLLLSLVLVTNDHAADGPKLFTEGVRATDPLSPEEERLKFHLPDGFKIQLVASEPDLRKPMNMAFDSVGRLWVTESREYPFPATNAATARDTIRIFSDFDDNGRARKVTTFATNLNIPIGLYPFRSPASTAPKPNPNLPSPLSHPLTWKCIAWSIPNIWLLEDTDGDGVADKQEKLYGPFDFSRDTHGNQASFRRGLDGWIYATHGFNNQSRVSGTDGHEISLPSGNVYRFRLDGSRIEHWTHGQVNPFGLTFDPLGNLYSADCHSSPIYQLLRGAHYPSFGRPHDGLGFAPTTIQHSHGSTAICGITHISDPSWPAEFQGNLFIGNVMTSRINRDRLELRGSTSVGHEMPDFLSTDDPWFRPVDLQFGPDGALWVADFYNRIIGHYEVPLLHPGRDRERGRLWRIVPPPGADINQLAVFPPGESARLMESPFARGGTGELLASANPVRRNLALQEFARIPVTPLAESLRAVLRSANNVNGPEGRAHLHSAALWLLQRGEQLDEESLLLALKDRQEIIRVQAARVLTERGLQAAAVSRPPGRAQPSGMTETLHAATLTALRDTSSAFVQRAAADALAANPHLDNINALDPLMMNTQFGDTHLEHTLALALREQFRLPGAFANAPDSRNNAYIASSLTNAEAASFLVRHIPTHPKPADITARYIQHAARYAPAADLPKLASLGRKQFAADLDTQAALFKAMQDGLATRGGALPPDLRAWGTDLAGQLLSSSVSQATWTYVPLNPAAPGRNPFAFEERTSADGQKTRLMSSLPHGETLTGILRSPVFVLPKQLSFYLCGHDGFPNQPAGGKNHVRLRLVKDTDKAEAPPGRADLPVGLPVRPSAHEGPLTISTEGRAAARPSHDGGLSRAVAGSEVASVRPHYESFPLKEGASPDDLDHPQPGYSPRRAESTSRRIGTGDPRVESLPRPGLEDVPIRRALVPTGREDAPTRRPLDPTRRPLDPTGRTLDSTGRTLDPTGRTLAPIGREGVPPRRDDVPARMVDAATCQEDDSTGRAAVPTRLAAASAAGVLPEGVVREAKVPRNDTAQKITWDLADLSGKRAVIEVTDGDDGKAYAWLAFGRFVPALPELGLQDTQGVGKRQLAGAELARVLLLDREPAIVATVAKLFAESEDGAVRAAAGRAWLALDPEKAHDPLAQVLGANAQPELVRAELAVQFGQLGLNRPLVAALTNAPTRLQTKFAAALVSTAAGAEQLLAAAEAGRIPARLLQDRTLADRLGASPARDAKVRLAALVKNLPPADVQLQKQIEARRAEFKPQQASAARGAEVFTKACAVCHLLEGKGALVGPQLDGIGGRGLERLLEDILDPNRNVDKAFRTTVYVLKDGETVSGLARREEGGAFIYALANGQEAHVPKADVKERRETETSLMPANFAEALTAAELNDLLAFLLGKSGK